MNRSLQLPPGKLAAQVAHAAVAAFLVAAPQNGEKWLEEGMPKIVLGVSDEGQLLHLFNAAQQAHLPAYVIQDAGKTVVPEGTITCLGIGPADNAAIDALTGALPLLP